jgi:hypothetical protein
VFLHFQQPDLVAQLGSALTAPNLPTLSQNSLIAQAMYRKRLTMHEREARGGRSWGAQLGLFTSDRA